MVQVPNGTAVRVLWGMWLLAALIVGSVYRSNLKAMLILPKLRLPFDNLQELTQTDIPCVVPAGSALMHIILVQPNFCFFFFLFFFPDHLQKEEEEKKISDDCLYSQQEYRYLEFVYSFFPECPIRYATAQSAQTT